MLPTFVFILALTLANLAIALNEWKKAPERVEWEAMTDAIDGANFKKFERIQRDVGEMKRVGRPTSKVLGRYIGVCFALNLLTVGVSAIPTLAVKALLR